MTIHYLWYEMLRVIERLNHKSLLAKTLLESLTWHSTRCFSDLEGEGYKTEAFIIPEHAINAPHRRDRVWIIAYTEHWAGGMDGWQQQEGRTKTTEPNENTDNFRCNSKEWESKSRNSGIRGVWHRNNGGFIANRLLPTPKAQDSRCAKRTEERAITGKCYTGYMAGMDN